jgi:type II secretory ATPase GspE/PulE/Tfp pilus assembly ATPase PilB-like protein
MFINREPISTLKRRAIDSGATFLRQAAINEVLSGETTLQEANRVTFIEANE